MTFFQKAGIKVNGTRLSVIAGLLLTSAIAYQQLPSASFASKIIHRMDLFLYDLRFNISLENRQVSASLNKIIIVDIDARSLKSVGRWPWSRKIVANLVENLIEQQVSTITFDMVFSEPENNLIDTLSREADLGKEHVLTKHLDDLRELFDYDMLMAEIIGKHDVILGYILHDESFAISELAEPTAFSDVPPEEVPAPFMKGHTSNIPVLHKSAIGTGFINAAPDGDGVVRRAPLVMRSEKGLQSSLALQTAMAFQLLDEVTVETVAHGGRQVVKGLHLGSQFIPTDKYGRMLIPFRGGAKTYPYYSAADILDGAVPMDELQGSIVLVGTSAIGLVDVRATPVGIGYPGVEAQANIVDALLTGNVPYKPDWASGANALIVVGLGLLLSSVMPLCGPLLMTAIGSGGLILVAYGNYWLWHNGGVDLSLSGPLIEVSTLYALFLSVGYFRASHQKEQIRSMFGQYVAPAHIDRLMEASGDSTFQGESREMTVLFSDIRNFTSISETLHADKLKDLLNRFFTPMTEIIFNQQGTVDKYVGDTIMTL